jgi:hypothetical protein
MKRSMNWFQLQKVAGQYLQPLAAPAHFASQQAASNWKIETSALLKTERAWYELLGKIWAAIKS